VHSVRHIKARPTSMSRIRRSPMVCAWPRSRPVPVLYGWRSPQTSTSTA